MNPYERHRLRCLWVELGIVVRKAEATGSPAAERLRERRERIMARLERDAA